MQEVPVNRSQHLMQQPHCDATCKHANSTSSSTCLQSIGGGGKPREPDRGSLATPGLMTPEDPGARIVSPGAVLLGIPRPAPCIIKSHSEPLVSSPSRGLPHPPRPWQRRATRHQHQASPTPAAPVPPITLHWLLQCRCFLRHCHRLRRARGDHD
jgi:hypothetical protein